LSEWSSTASLASVARPALRSPSATYTAWILGQWSSGTQRGTRGCDPSWCASVGRSADASLAPNGTAERVLRVVTQSVADRPALDHVNQQEDHCDDQQDV